MNTPIQWQQGTSRSTTTGLNMAWEMAGPDNAPTIVLVAGLAWGVRIKWPEVAAEPHYFEFKRLGDECCMVKGKCKSRLCYTF